MKTKRKGTRNELKAKKILEKQGYSVVKSGGSLGPWDLVAICKDALLLIQVKSNRPVSPAVLDKLRESLRGIGPLAVFRELWTFKDWSRKNPTITDLDATVEKDENRSTGE